MTKKYKHSCGLYAVFHSERCQTPGLLGANIMGSIPVICLNYLRNEKPCRCINSICRAFSKLLANFANYCYNPIFDSQIYQNTAESLILPGFFSGAFSFYYIVFFLNQIWMIDFYDFSRDCLLSFWISFIFLLVRNS